VVCQRSQRFWPESSALIFGWESRSAESSARVPHSRQTKNATNQIAPRLGRCNNGQNGKGVTVAFRARASIVTATALSSHHPLVALLRVICLNSLSTMFAMAQTTVV
jgi:hypothetical protein